MDPVRNPYSPGAGRRPAALVGRDRQIEDWDVRLSRIEQGRDAESLGLYGLRGVGKTVLLNELARRARRREWIVARIEADADRSLRAAIGEALHGPLADLATPSAGRRLLKALKTALSFKASYDLSGTWNFGLDLTESAGGGADTGVLDTDLFKVVNDVGEAAAERGVGIAILIDEAQDLPFEEMKVVASVAHRAGQDGWPVVFAVAGLPSLPRLFAEAKTYTERLFPFAPVEHLEEPLARQAIVDPAVAEGVSWEEAAAAHVLAASGGYPYFLQQFGKEAWNAAEGQVITEVAARVGVERGRRDLDNGFFRSRWDRATRTEQEYLRQMSRDGDAGSTTSDVAHRMGGRRVESLGPVRAALMGKGIVYAPSHGVVQFTVPGMADFIARQIDD